FVFFAFFASVLLLPLLLVVAWPSLFFGTANEFTVYGYCACKKCCDKSDKLTYTETTALQDRTIAVDPSVIPLGSTVLIYYEDSLIGIYQAEDIGGDIKGNTIDMCFENHSDALDWGINDCDVVIVDAKG
ncbi:hypothetical protein CG709_20560, partial [Lachnotalea glycerini]